MLIFGGILRIQSVPEGDALQSHRGFYELQGIITTAPKVKDWATVLQFEVKQIKVDDEWQDISGTAQIYAPKFPGFGTRDFPYYHYGDRIKLEGMLQSPDPPESEDDFDFAAYLAQQGIYSMVYSPANIELLESGQKSDPMKWIHHLRRSMSESLEDALPEPQCALAQAMLLGERSSISSEERENFSRAGTAHLLAISGIHIPVTNC